MYPCARRLRRTETTSGNGWMSSTSDWLYARRMALDDLAPLSESLGDMVEHAVSSARGAR